MSQFFPVTVASSSTVHFCFLATPSAGLVPCYLSASARKEAPRTLSTQVFLLEFSYLKESVVNLHVLIILLLKCLFQILTLDLHV